jgi:hypothetical protein
MHFSPRRVLSKAAIAAAALLLPTLASAQNHLPAGGVNNTPSDAPAFLDPAAPAATPLRMPELTLTPPADPAPADAAAKPVFLDDAPAAPAAEQPNIHGFANVTFTTAYLTPRGLLVFDKGVVIQPVVGLVLPIGDFGPIKNYTWVAGVWNCITASQGDPGVGGWNEMDFFFSQSATVIDVINLNLTYGEWNFPQSVPVGLKPKAEQNLDLKISYDDSKLWGDSGFSLNPYVDCWDAVAGSSTVVLGRGGGTGYFEIGFVPTYTLKAIPDYPIKITLPTYVSTGPRNYWSAGPTKVAPENFGVAFIGLNLSVPLSFIPARYGHWHADAGVTFDYLINGSLVDAGTILTGNTDRKLVEGTCGFGVNF